jgi:hypothetical protein
MEHEFKHGDVVVQRKGSGAGLIVWYHLPHPGSKAIAD